MDEIKVSQLDAVDEIKDTDQIMLVTGGANKKVLGNYINEHGVKIGSSEPDTSQKVWFKQGKNLFGNYVIINGWITGTTMRVNILNGNRMAFIPCQPNTTYTISRSVLTGSFRVGDYTTIPQMTSSNVDTTLVKTVVENNTGTTITYTTSASAKYLIVHYGNISDDANINESLASIQVEYGETATTFEAFITPDILSDNISMVQQFIKPIQIDVSAFKTSNINIITRANLWKVGNICIFNISCTTSSSPNSNNPVFSNLPYKPVVTTEINYLPRRQCRNA